MKDDFKYLKSFLWTEMKQDYFFYIDFEPFSLSCKCRQHQIWSRGRSFYLSYCTCCRLSEHFSASFVMSIYHHALIKIEILNFSSKSKNLESCFQPSVLVVFIFSVFDLTVSTARKSSKFLSFLRHNKRFW